MINDAGKHGVKKALSTWKARPLWRQSRAFPRKPNTKIVEGHSGPGNWGTAQDQRGGGFGGVRVDEVTGDAYPLAEVSGGRKAAQGRSDREHRSEEHTSELQSQFHLVCRLLLE